MPSLLKTIFEEWSFIPSYETSLIMSYTLFWSSFTINWNAFTTMFTFIIIVCNYCDILTVVCLFVLICYITMDLNLTLTNKWHYCLIHCIISSLASQITIIIREILLIPWYDLWNIETNSHIFWYSKRNVKSFYTPEDIPYQSKFWDHLSWENFAWPFLWP